MLPDNTPLRFLSRVKAPDGCWEWDGGRTAAGYGTLTVDGQHIYAHRYAYESVFGPIGAELCILHRCDNPPCVRPDHLFVGTKADNTADMLAKGRQRWVPVRGQRHPLAKLTDAEVLAIRAIDGVTQREIAARYGITQTLVSMIRLRKIWTHI